MSQDLVTLILTETQLLAIDKALSDLEAQLVDLVALMVPQRRKLSRLGDKSEAFCRLALSSPVQNPQVVPPSLKVTESLDDLVAPDAFRPRLQRLQRLQRARMSIALTRPSPVNERGVLQPLVLSNRKAAAMRLSVVANPEPCHAQGVRR